MRRRALLGAVGTTGALLAGCVGVLDDKPERMDSVFIENWDDRTYQGSVAVWEESGWWEVWEREDELILDAEYEVPSKTGLEIPEIGVMEHQYRIRAMFVEETQDFHWDVRDCSAMSEGDEQVGNRDAGMVIVESSLHIINNACDAVSAGYQRDLEYVDHEEHQVT